MLLFLFFSATLIPDEIHFPDNESFHRLTMDSMMALTEKYFGERDPIYWEPVDASRYYFTTDSFYLVVLDEHWERIIWQKCREQSKGFYTAGPAKRYGGKDHAPGVLQRPKAIDMDGNDIFVADYDNNRVSRLTLDRNSDTITVDCHYTGPYDGMAINHPVDVAINYDFIYRYAYILDKGNNRYIKLFWPYNNFLYSYNGLDDDISFDCISGLSVRRISGSSNPPRYYVHLMGKDTLYLLKEQSGNPPVKLINVLPFPGAKFTGIDATTNVVLVVDNARGIILGLAPDLSRSYFAYSSSSALSSGVFNVSIHSDDIVTFAPYLSSTGMDFFKLDLTNIPDDEPDRLSTTGYEDHIELTFKAPAPGGFEKFLIERREAGEELWAPIGWRKFKVYWSNYSDFQVERGKKYFYRVRSYKKDYYTAATNVDSITVPYCNSPANLQAVIENSIVILTWEDISNFNTGYEIKRKDVDGNQVYWSVGDVDSVIDDNVDLSKFPYIYWVRAFDGSGHTSAWSGSSDQTPPSVDITSPGQYRVVYKGLFTIEWDASDDNGISSQKLYFYILPNIINLDGNVRSKEVNLQVYGQRGYEEHIELKATDYGGNKGNDDTRFVIIDPAEADIPLNWEHDGNWKVTIYTSYPHEFRTIYKGIENDWERVTLSSDHQFWQDQEPLSEGETRNYLVCYATDPYHFIHFSDTITVHRPYDIHPCPVLYTFTGDSFEQDNSLLPASEFTHQLTRDYYILKKNPEAIDGTYRFKIIEGLDNTYIDLIKLRIIDHSVDTKIGALPNGEVIPIKLSSPPTSFIDKEDKDRKEVLVSEEKGFYNIEKGNYLDIHFSPKGDYLYSVLAPPKNPVEVRPGNREPDVIYSRMNGSTVLLPFTDSIVRFIPKDTPCGIDYVSKAFRLPDILIKEKEALPVNLPWEVAKEDSEYCHLSPGDTLEFTFRAPDLDPLLSRSYCLEVVGYYLPVGESKGSKEREQREKVYESYIRPSSSIFTGNILLNASSNERRTVKIEVIDRIGRIVKQKDVRLSRGEQMINLGELKSGIYFIKVSAERGDIHKITVIR